MSRNRAYARLSLLALAVAASASVLTGNVALGAILGAIVFTTGFLAIELGRRQRRLLDRDGEE